MCDGTFDEACDGTVGGTFDLTGNGTVHGASEETCDQRFDEPWTEMFTCDLKKFSLPSDNSISYVVTCVAIYKAIRPKITTQR